MADIKNNGTCSECEFWHNQGEACEDCGVTADQQMFPEEFLKAIAHAVAIDDLKRYLLDHEDDIARDINDYNDLARIFLILFKRPAKKD